MATQKQVWKAQTLEQLAQFYNFLRANFQEPGYSIEWKKYRESRSLSQNAFQHVIYDEISTFLIRKGRPDCTPEWCKKMLKNRFLGWIDEEFTDVITGEKTMRAVLRPTAGLDVGEAVHYTDQIIEWAYSIGCEIKIPANSEYVQYKEAQNV